eukprot:gene27021-2248_t
MAFQPWQRLLGRITSLLSRRGGGCGNGGRAELATCLKRDGFLLVAEAVGADHKPKVKKGGGCGNGGKAELAACLKRDGFLSVAEAVGADHKPTCKKGGWLW